MTQPTPDNLHELAAAYALGALEPADAKAFEALLATSPEAQREVAEYREVGALLALNAGNAAPSAGLKDRVIARATSQPVLRMTPRRNPTSWVPWLALAASLVAVAGLALTGSRLKRELEAQRVSLAALQDSLTVRSETLARREKELNNILDPNVQLIRMGDPGTPKPVVQLFLNRKKGSVMVHAFQLQPAGDKRTYQLWFIPKNGKPIPSVTFNAEYSGHALVDAIPVPEGVDLAAAAITDEPEGGSLAPTTTPFLVGTFGS